MRLFEATAYKDELNRYGSANFITPKRICELALYAFFVPAFFQVFAQYIILKVFIELAGLVSGLVRHLYVTSCTSCIHILRHKVLSMILCTQLSTLFV